MTFQRADLEQGVEPDRVCYFGVNASRVRGKDRLTLGSGQDPPLDLVVEADMTHRSIDRIPIDAVLGDPRDLGYCPDSVRLLGHQPDQNDSEQPTSRAFAGFRSVDARRFFKAARTENQIAWIGSSRRFLRETLRDVNEAIEE